MEGEAPVPAAPPKAASSTREAPGATASARDASAATASARDATPARPPGFWRVARRVLHAVYEDQCDASAAQIAFFMMFAIFPFLLFLISLLAYLPVPHLLERLMGLFGRVLPEQALDLVRGNVERLLALESGGLLSFGLVVAMWAASNALGAVIQGLNRVHRVRESRPLWKVRLIAVLLAAGVSLFALVATMLLVFGAAIGHWGAARIGVGHQFALVWRLVRWPVIVLFLVVAMANLYYFAPDVKQRWRWISPGSVFAVLGWIAASLGFSYFVRHFGSYNVTYGSLGTVIILLSWLYLSAFFILVGGEINAVLDRVRHESKAPAGAGP